MTSRYLMIDEEPAPAVFEAGWFELAPGRYVLDRQVWNGRGVSRDPAECVVLRVDPEDGAWEVKNGAVDRLLILHDGVRRYEILTGMSMTLRPGMWRGRLTDAFSFVVTSERPVGPVRDRLTRDRAKDEGTTKTSRSVELAREFLDDPAHRKRRLALAYLWRRHLAHGGDAVVDIPLTRVGRAFGHTDKTTSKWRSELARVVFLDDGDPDAIRDFVLKRGLLTRHDVMAADRFVASQSRPAS